MLWIKTIISNHNDIASLDLMLDKLLRETLLGHWHHQRNSNKDGKLCKVHVSEDERLFWFRKLINSTCVK